MSTPTASCAEDSRVRINPSPRWPALPVTRILMSGFPREACYQHRFAAHSHDVDSRSRSAMVSMSSACTLRSAVLRSALTLLAVGSLGCVPAPGYVEVGATVGGVVVRGERPVSGIEVLVSEKRGGLSGEHPLAQDTTDGTGSFTIEAVREFRLVRPLYGDALYEWYICIDDGQSRVPAYSAASLGVVPSGIGLRCDLSAPRGARRLCAD